MTKQALLLLNSEVSRGLNREKNSLHPALPLMLPLLQNKVEINGDTTSDPSQVIKNGSSLGFPFAIKSGNGNNAPAFEIASGGQEPAEANQMGCVPYKDADSLSNVPSMISSWPNFS
jgi:hypothetical protein